MPAEIRTQCAGIRTFVQAPMFSFLRLSGSDPRVGVEMQSTGEAPASRIFGH